MILRKWLNTRSRPSSAAAIIEIDRWQLTGILGGVLVACAVAFFSGVLVGKKSAPPVAHQSDVVAAAESARALAASHRERNLAMAEVSPGTTFLDEGLSQPIADPIPSDPTAAARMETHRQLQDFRAAGRRAEVPPAIGGGAALPDAMPVIIDAPQAGSSGGYTLQVSVFESPAPAQAVAAELEAAGNAVTLRQVSAQGKTVYRVEVGDFRSAEAATSFQRRFERDSGYSGVLVPKP